MGRFCRRFLPPSIMRSLHGAWLMTKYSMAQLSRPGSRFDVLCCMPRCCGFVFITSLVLLVQHSQLCCKVPVRRSPKIVLDFLADLCRCIDADECEEKNTVCERRTSCMSYDFHTKTPPAAVFICSRHLCRCIDADECEEKNTVLRA